MNFNFTQYFTRPLRAFVSIIQASGFILAVASVPLEVSAQSGLVAHYRFNGSFLDQTSNANHALATGNPAFVTDRKGTANSAIGLGGCAKPQFLKVPKSASLQFTNAMSVSFWAQVDLSTGMDPGTGACNANGRQVFFAKGGDGFGGSPPGVQGLTFQQNGQQQVSFESSTYAGQFNTINSQPLPGNNWHYYTYTITTTNFRLYIDAQLIRSLPISVDFEQVNQQDLFLGIMGPKSSPVLGITNWYPLKGALDDFRVFNREITQQEIATLYYSDDLGNCTPSVSVVPTGDQIICEILPLALRSSPTAADVQLQWLKNSQPIAQATLDSLVVNQAGSYRLEATRRTATWKHAMAGIDRTLNDVQFVGNTGWIVGEYATLLKSTNAGINWDTIPLNRETNFYTVHFVNAQTGWIGGASGLLLKSIDGGLNWAQQYIPILNDVEQIQFLDQYTGFAQGGGHLFKTTDGGDSWTEVPLPGSSPGKFTFVDTAFGWIIVGRNIYKTENGGSSWNLQKTISQFSDFGSIYALDRNRVWASYFNTQNPTTVTRTTDGGLTWTETDLPVPGSFPTLSYILVNDLYFIDGQIGYAVGPIYQRVLASYGVNSGGIFQTKDGGLSWSLIYNNPFNVTPKAISFASPSHGSVVGLGGFHISTNVSLAPNRTYLPLKSVGGTAQKIMAVGGKFKSYEAGAHPDSKAVTLTSSTGYDWTKTETGYAGGGGGFTLSQVKFKNSQFGWQVGYSTLSRTRDGGNTWQSLLAPGPPTAFNYVVEKAYFTGDTTGFCLLRTPIDNSGAGLVAFSGNTRTAPSIPYKDTGDPAGTGMLDLQFIDDNNGFITTSNGKLVKTTNGGASWSVQLVKANTALNRCYFATPWWAGWWAITG